MRRFNLLSQIAGIVFVAFLLASLVAFVLSRGLVLEDISQEQQRQMLTRLSSAQGTIEHFLRLGHIEGVRETVSAMGSDMDLEHAFVADAEGVMLASTRYSEEGRRVDDLDYLFSPETVERIGRTRTSGVRVDEKPGFLDGYISICDPKAAGGLRVRSCGYLFHRINLDYHREQALGFLHRQAGMTFAGFSFVLLLVLGVFHRIITLRVNQILSTLTRFAAGERQARIWMRGDDELVKISNSIDQILNELAEDEMALLQSEQFKRAMIDSANAAIICTDADGTICFFSAGAERMLGYESHELVGKESGRIFHDVDEVARRLDAERDHDASGPSGLNHFMLQADRGVYEDEWLYVRRDGTRLNVNVSVTALRDASGEVHRYLAVARDITEEKRTAQRLRLAELVFQSAGEAILVTDAHRRVIDVNPAYTFVTGFSRDDVIGERPRLLAPEAADKNFGRLLWGSVRSEGFWSGELDGERINGERFPLLMTISAIRDDQGSISNYVGVCKDVTEQKAAEAELQRMAYFDRLTSLPNRTLFKDRLQNALAVARRAGTRVAVVFIDLDRFKYVNDTLGHDAGDELLQEAAVRLTATVRQSDTVARLGGDEFTLIVPDASSASGLGVLATKVINRLQEAFVISGREVFIGASIGIAISPEDGSDVATLTKSADTAMYLAKQAGRGTYRFFKPEINARNEKRMKLEARLRHALENGEFELHYQPRITLASNQVTGFEALLRWHDEDYGMMTRDYVALAEETGLIVPIGRWVRQSAVAELRRWRKSGFEDLQVSVSLSPREFKDRELLSDVAALVESSALGPSALQFELREAALVDDAGKAREVLRQLRALGIQLSIADVGAGYSSLGYLKQFPIQCIKVDESFVREVATDPQIAAIVRAIISLGEPLGLEVIAEGVETNSQHEFLHREGCLTAQGYLYAGPMPAASVLAFLGTRLRAPGTQGGALAG